MGLFNDPFGTVGNVFGNLFQPSNVQQPQWPAPQLFPYAEPLVQQIQGGIPGLNNLFGLQGEAVNKARGLMNAPAIPGDEELFRLMSRRYREQMLPGMAARGLATSGPGINAESQGIQELSTLFGEKGFERSLARQEAERQGLTSYQSAIDALKQLETLPMEIRLKLLQTILSQAASTPQAGKSPLEQLGGLFSIKL